MISKNNQTLLITSVFCVLSTKNTLKYMFEVNLGQGTESHHTVKQQYQSKQDCLERGNRG